MKSSPQTAIRGVASVAAINVLARVIGYGKHVVITAYIGLTAQLDAFYVALTILSIFILSFGDVFDSLGVPRLVRTLQEEGETSFRRTAGTLLAFSGLLAVGLSLLLLALSPWTPWIAPGFTPDKRGHVLWNLVCLGPVVLLYLPYHALGSILRTRRRFKDFYLGELLNAVVTLGCLYAGRHHVFIVPLSMTAGFVASFLYILLIGRGEIVFPEESRFRNSGEFLRPFLALAPFYLTSYLFPLVDRAFASYLPTGGVSALSYGFLIAMLPSSILMMDNIFLTPLAETPDKGEMMSRILGGILIVFVPISIFLAVYSRPIIRVCLERGVFTPDATRMTADALTYFSIAIPAFLFWPICYRLFQVLEKLKAIYAVTVAAVAVNVLFNSLFMAIGMGIKGLALSTSIANYLLVAVSILIVNRSGISIFNRKTSLLLATTLLVGGTSLALSRSLGPDPGSIPGLFIGGLLYFLSVGVLYLALPNEEIRSWRRTVVEDLFRGRFAGPAGGRENP